MTRSTRMRTALVAAVALVATGLGVGAASADDGEDSAAPVEILNGNFDDGHEGWFDYANEGATITVDSDSEALCVSSTAAEIYDAGVGIDGLPFPNGTATLSFDAKGDGEFKALAAYPDPEPVNPWDEIELLNPTFTVDDEDDFTHHEYDFEIVEDPNGAVKFQVGGSDNGTLCIDNVVLTVVPSDDAPADEPVEVFHHDFSDDLNGWWPFGDEELNASSGELCISTDEDVRWEAGIGNNGWNMPAGEATLTFNAQGSGTYKVNIEVPDNGVKALESEFTLDNPDLFTAQSFEFSTIAGAGASIKFEVGGEPLCLDDIILTVVPGEGDGAGDGGSSLVPGFNLLRNGDFSNGTAGWGPYGLDTTNDDGQFCGTVNGPSSDVWDAGFNQKVELPAGDYVLTFDASTTGSFRAVVQRDDPYLGYGSRDVAGADMTSYEVPVSVGADDPHGTVAFHLGGLEEAESYEFCIDNIFLGEPSVEYVEDDGWDDWTVTGSDKVVNDGVMCVAVPAGTINTYDVNVTLDPLDLPAVPMTLKYTAKGTNDGSVRTVVGEANDPWEPFSYTAHRLTDEMTEYTMHFEMPRAHADSQIAFQVGGADFDWEFCVESVSLASGGERPAYTPETGPAVKVNQHGYEVDGPKRATLVTDATDALDWALVNANTEVTTASGKTAPFGEDPSAGENVHVITFDGSHPAGTYVLRVGDDESHPFTIAAEQYTQLRYDALNYFYLARSGIEIEASIVGEEYARGAGHVSEAGGSDTNQGDYNVACQPAEDSAKYYGEAWTCDYTLDVVGGWYDAGDHGKYVVNGGISVAQVMGTYERLLRASDADRALLGDSTLNLPETGNGVPDALDEARWQLDFMMSMTVPDGEPLEGMVHHKVHDFGWTSLPLLPENGSHTRYLHRPSTAATLNLSAAAAQGARLWEQYDADYAAELLEVAESTWEAALGTPDLYAPASDGDNGGGPYDDDDVTDEFYWAAAELFITTGESKYEEFLLSSPVHQEESFMGPGLSWFELAAVAKINLATVDNDFSDRAAIAEQVITAGKAVRDVQKAEPFGQPMSADGYDWGSSSEVLNAIVIMGAAYDLSGDETLLAAAQESMDYLMGRNALGQSYITDYGTQFSKNQHSRWFAASLSAAQPHPPAGSVAGGPNRMAETWDLVIQGLYPQGDCAPQKCYVDDIESWSTNEITINWNSALSAAVNFLASPEAPAEVPDSTDDDDKPDETDKPDDKEKPGKADPKAPLSEDEVKKKDKGGIDVPATAYPGDTITIKVGTQHTGTPTMTYIYSEATLIGQSIVDADGNIRVTIPADTPPGLHTIAVYDADGNLLGWDTIEILAATNGGDDGSLSTTGADGFVLPLAIALVLVFAGVALVVRRQTAQ